MTTKHPAHGPVSLDRLHQIREHLQHDTQYSNGGNRAYILADVLKVIDGAIAAFGAEPVAWMIIDIDTGEKIIRPDRSYFEGPCQPLYAAQPAPVMPDSENGLMPCPFCGGKARQLTIEQDNDPHFGGDVITCTECGASSHVEFGFKENLKSAWNSRAAMLNGDKS